MCLFVNKKGTFPSTLSSLLGKMFLILYFRFLVQNENKISHEIEANFDVFFLKNEKWLRFGKICRKKIPAQDENT